MAQAKGGFEVNAELFFKRAEAMVAHWQANAAPWHDVKSFFVTSGKGDDEASVYWQSIAVHLYLFDAELEETILVFVADRVFFMGSKSKVKKLKPLEEYAKANGTKLSVTFVTKSKADNTENYKILLDAIKEAGGGTGTFPKETPTGAFAEGWLETVGQLDAPPVDISGGFQEALASKDELARKSVKVAAVLSAAFMRKMVVAQLEELVEENDRTQTNSKIAQGVDDIFEDPTSGGFNKKALEAKWPAVKKINTVRVESAYPTIVQSGGRYNLKANAEADDEPLHYGTEESPGVMIVSLGARYKGYCANISRTFLVNPTEGQTRNYLLLLELRERLHSLCTPGRRVGDLLKMARDLLEEKAPELAPKLTRNLGSGIGLLFRAKHFLLTAKNDALLQENMVLNLSFGFSDVDLDKEVSDKRSGKYALMVSDTVMVKAEGVKAEVLTKGCGCAKADAIWELNGEDDQVEEDAKRDNLEGLYKGVTGGDEARNATAESATDERLSRQQLLAARDRKEALKRFKNKDKDKVVKKATTQVSYESVTRFPNGAVQKKDQIYVDNSSDSIFLPICGTMVPFHVTYIKNVSRIIDPGGRFVELRINFWTPATGGSSVDRPLFKDTDAQFLKEITLKSSNLTKINANYQMVMSMRKEYKNREKEKADKESLVTMQQLKLNTGAINRLTDVQMKPTVGGRGRRSGTLELHKNGLRYKSSQNAPLDITYQNIKYAFYQAAVNDMKSEFRDDYCRVHFHLRHDIMVGKKKVNSLQFCTQIGEEHIKLHEVRRSAYDPDELEEENRERQRRSRINKMFKAFAMKVQDESRKTDFEVEFDIPYKELVFTGRAEVKGSNKGEASFMPTKDCLVDLSETPFFVLDISLVEIVYFERVTHGTKNFDVVFVYKDYENFQRIDAIPSRKLESLKTWVDTCNLRYYEGVAALKWKEVLGHARADPEDFWEQGGWETYLGDTGGSGSDDDSDDESNDGSFSGGEAEEEEEYESDEFESEGEEEEEEDEYAGEDELSEEGEDWDELERKAAKDDKEGNMKRMMDDDGDGRPSKKGRGRR